MPYDLDLIVIGGGAAGLTGAGVAATLGASVMMVESEKLGGDCTWYGCVPSKTLLKGARIAHQIGAAGKYGLIDQDANVPFGKMMEYVRRVRDEVYEEADRPEIYQDMGIEVVSGQARFIDDHQVEIEGAGGTRRVSARYFLIATGAKAFVPPIDGINDIPYLTNESLFELTVQPERLIIVGGGPIGSEMAQSFARLGSRVTVVDFSDRILSKDDPELSALVKASLENDGVQFTLGAGVRGFSKVGDDIVVTVDRVGTVSELRADAVLMATGRRANVASLNLEAAGVATTKHGVTVNDRCRTNKRHIYASGDVTGRYQFTHMSEHMSKIAVTNMLLHIPMRIDKKHVPWVTFTDPELAHVGATKSQLDESGIKYKTYRFPYSKIDRAITDSETTGWIKVHARPRDGRIYGVDIAGTAAGELISEYAVAMRNGISLRKLSDTIHPYPTYALGARRAADQWYVQKQSPTLVRMLKWLFRYRGPVLEFGPDQIV